MKHVFVVNPHAGYHGCTTTITKMVEAYTDTHSDFQYHIYHTQCPGDATRWVRQYCTEHSQEAKRFYACGGDGTINEVLTGLMHQPNCQLSCMAFGSGNDFIKYYGTHADFNDLERLVEGTPHLVDVMQVTDSHSAIHYSINVCNFGFDAEVVRHMERVRRYPIIGGSNAYTTGIVLGLFGGMRTPINMQVDGNPFYEGDILLCAMSNGRNYGGNYCCAPHAQNDDGLIDIGLFRPMSVFTLARLIGSYTDGSHLQHPAAKKYIRQSQCKRIDLQSRKPFWMAVDGELIEDTRFEIENIHHAITFVSPRK